MNIEQTLNERGSRYGDFSDHARICQALKEVMMDFTVYTEGARSTVPWGALPDIHKQALEVIADKIARILSGDPNYADNWHDIQGYAKLVEDRLPKENGGNPSAPVVEHEFDETRVDRVASSHGDGEHYTEVKEPGRPRHLCGACGGGHALHLCQSGG